MFQRLIDTIPNDMDPWDVLEELMSLRAEFAINHAIVGFNMDTEKALELLRNFNDDLTKYEQDQRDRLVAAVDNLVDFAVAEEFHAFDELPDDIDQDDEETLEECGDVCHKYNFTYANTENGDIEYSMAIAAMWIMLSDRTYLTYMTMGDERVRPWHLSLEGETYSKDSFPAWMIPPIEHSCRCFLVSSNDIKAIFSSNIQAKILAMPDFVNPTFKESVAKCGRIFSDEHPYFNIPVKHKDKLKEISTRIKSKYYV